MTKQQIRRTVLAAALAGATVAAPVNAGAAAPPSGAAAAPIGASRASALSRVTVPATAVAAGAKATVAVRARNGGRRPQRIAVTFHLSADRRLGRGDLRLGTARSARLKRGASGTARLAATVPATARAGAWVVLACPAAGRRSACAASARKLLVTARGAAPQPPDDRPPAPGPSGPGDPMPDRPGPPPPPPDPGPAPEPDPPALALRLDDGVTWGDPWQWPVDPDMIVTTRVRLGAGLPGQAGYDRRTVAAMPALTGTTTVLATRETLDVPGNHVSEGDVAAVLPFAVPIAGVTTRRLIVSTNGWIATSGSVARMWEPPGAGDHRGQLAVTGALAGIVAPLLADLRVGRRGDAVSSDEIALVEAADGERFAIRWRVHTNQAHVADQVALEFQAVFHRDGRIRFDYLAGGPFKDFDGTAADRPVAIGLSPGLAGHVADLDLARRGTLPAGSVLFTPRAVSATPVAAGSVTVELPRGGTFLDAADGCELTAAPTFATPGRVVCATPALSGAGGELSFRWRRPAEWLLQLIGWEFDHAARWTAGDEEADATAEVLYGRYPLLDGATLAARQLRNEPAGPVIEIRLERPAGAASMQRPRLTAEVPAGVGVLSARLGESIAYPAAQLAHICSGLPIPPGGGTVSCQLPNGFESDLALVVAFSLDPAAAPQQVPVTWSAGNLPPASTTVTVVPGLGAG